MIKKIKIAMDKLLTVLAMLVWRGGYAFDIRSDRSSYNDVYAELCEELFRLYEKEGKDISVERRNFEKLKNNWR